MLEQHESLCIPWPVPWSRENTFSQAQQ